MAIVSYSVPSETKQAIIELAKKLRVTRSKVVELAVESYVKDEESKIVITLRDDWQKQLKKALKK